MLNLYNAYERLATEPKEQNSWCVYNSLDIKSMKQISQIRQQLVQFCNSNNINTDTSSTDVNILKCLVSGMFLQSAHLQADGTYRTVLGRKQAFIHPSSSMHRTIEKPECIIYHELVLTSKCYMRFVSSIEPKWINEHAIMKNNK